MPQSVQHVSDVQGLPWMHKVCLWLGIAMDVGAKAGLCMQLRRFALHAHWAWLAVVATFFALSSLTSLGWVAACSLSCQFCYMLKKARLWCVWKRDHMSGREMCRSMQYLAGSSRPYPRVSSVCSQVLHGTLPSSAGGGGCQEQQGHTPEGVWE